MASADPELSAMDDGRASSADGSGDGRGGKDGLLLLHREALYEAAPFFFRGWMAIDMVTWGWMGVQAFLTVIAIALLTRGYQVAETSYMAVFEYSLLIFAALWTYLLFAQSLAVTSIIGFALIASAGIIISRALPSADKA